MIQLDFRSRSRTKNPTRTPPKNLWLLTTPAPDPTPQPWWTQRTLLLVGCIKPAATGMGLTFAFYKYSILWIYSTLGHVMEKSTKRLRPGQTKATTNDTNQWEYYIL